MAAGALIPLGIQAAEAILPVLIPKIGSWIHHAQDIIPAQGQGANRQDLVVQIAKVALTKAGVSAANMPSDEMIKGMVETVYQQIKPTLPTTIPVPQVDPTPVPSTVSNNMPPVVTPPTTVNSPAPVAPGPVTEQTLQQAIDARYQTVLWDGRAILIVAKK